MSWIISIFSEDSKNKHEFTEKHRATLEVFQEKFENYAKTI
jgi:hypothetical protein